MIEIKLFLFYLKIRKILVLYSPGEGSSVQEASAFYKKMVFFLFRLTKRLILPQLLYATLSAYGEAAPRKSEGGKGEESPWLECDKNFSVGVIT